MGPYWKVILYGSIVGAVLSVGILNLYYLIFANDYVFQTFLDGLLWGTALALVTSVLVTVGTIGLARSLGKRRGRGLFVLLSVLSAVAGWLVLGVLNGLLVSWNFFFGFPFIAGVAGVMTGIVSAIAMFIVSASRRVDDEGQSVDDAAQIFDVSLNSDVGKGRA